MSPAGRSIAGRATAPTAVADLPTIAVRLGRIDAALRTARIVLEDVARRWQAAPASERGRAPRRDRPGQGDATNAAVLATDEALRIAGGPGFLGGRIERAFRDARGWPDQPTTRRHRLPGICPPARRDERAGGCARLAGDHPSIQEATLMAIAVALDLRMFIDGRSVEAAGGALARGPQPGHERARRSRPCGDRGRRRPGCCRRASRLPRRPLAKHADAGAGDDHEPAGRPARRARRRAGPARDAPDRHLVQAPARIRLRVRLGQPALLRDPDPAPRRQGRGRVQRLAHEHDPARADRRVRPGRAMELPDVDGHLEDRTGPGGGQLGGPQARIRHAPDHDPAGRARQGGRAARRRPQRRHRSWRRRRGGDRRAPGCRPDQPDR